MTKGKITPLYMLFLIGSILIVLNSALVVSTGASMILSSSPSITRYSNWEDFKSSVTNETTSVTIFHKEPDERMEIEALKEVNVSSKVERQILSYSGGFPGDQSIRRDPQLLKQWVIAELAVSNETISENRLISVENINKTSMWGRLVSGIPGVVEGGLAYIWFILSIVILIFAVMVYLKPNRNRSLGPWIIIFSLLTFAAGGGFIIGALLCIVFGFTGVQWTKNPKDTFFGTLFNVARLNPKSIKSIAENTTKMQTAVITMIFVSVLSSLGIGLYAYNVNLMSSKDTFSILRATYDVLVRGQVFIGPEVYFGILSSIIVGIVKWLILSTIVYVVGEKLLGREFKFSNMAILMAFVYVPEILQALTPALFTNEPFLSQGIGIGFIPVPFTWALLLFYVSRLWAFAILVIAIETVMEMSRSRAIGVGLFVGTLYFLVNYIFVYPQLQMPGLRIEFSNSMETMLMAASVLVLVTFFLGVFKKET